MMITSNNSIAMVDKTITSFSRDGLFVSRNIAMRFPREWTRNWTSSKLPSTSRSIWFWLDTSTFMATALLWRLCADEFKAESCTSCWFRISYSSVEGITYKLTFWVCSLCCARDVFKVLGTRGCACDHLPQMTSIPTVPLRSRTPRIFDLNSSIVTWRAAMILVEMRYLSGLVFIVSMTFCNSPISRSIPEHTVRSSVPFLVDSIWEFGGRDLKTVNTLPTQNTSTPPALAIVERWACGCSSGLYCTALQYKTVVTHFSASSYGSFGASSAIVILTEQRKTGTSRGRSTEVY